MSEQQEGIVGCFGVRLFHMIYSIIIINCCSGRRVNQLANERTTSKTSAVVGSSAM
jgi:hypothetical protein